MLQVISVVFVVVPFLTVSGLQCSSKKLCKCRDFEGKLFANCENLKLSNVPKFSEDVIGISLHNNYISEFPKTLPVNVSYLDISKNSLTRIDKKSLTNYPLLRNLSVSQNALRSVEIGSFVNSRSLVNLDLSFNQELTIEVLVNISRDLKHSTSIRVLNLEHLQSTYGTSFIVKKYHIVDLKHISLEELNLASNRINSFEIGVFSMLPRTLKVFNIANNVLSFGLYITEIGNLRNVVSLNVSYQSFFHQIWVEDFLNVCNDTRDICKSSYRDDITQTQNNVVQTRWLSTIPGKANITIYLPPKLKIFYFHDNMYKLELQDFSFKTINGSKITHLFMQNNIIYSLTGPIVGLDRLIYADFSNNFCSFISIRFFDSFPDLTYLDLSHNALGEILENDVKGSIFGNLYKLSYLNLTRNRIVRLPFSIFRNLIHLKLLNLSYNSLSEFAVPILHMKSLKWLDFSNNQLSYLDKPTRSAIDELSKTRHVFVNLKNNRLACNCEQLDFVKWMHSSRNVTFVDFDEYTCTYMDNSHISFTDMDRLLQQMEKRCASYTFIITLMTSLIIILLTVTVSGIFYRYRWTLRYVYYVAKERWRDNVQRSDVTGNENSYYFDAFVSYADKDRSFVIELVKRLEIDYNLKLCIHHRDFMPGTGIADNITNAIHYSRRTVCIMTSAFLDSYWCLFELNMARMEAIYSRNGKNVLFLIILEKNAITKLPFSFMDLVENNSYLEFPGDVDSDEVTAFRKKLGSTLKSNDYDSGTLFPNANGHGFIDPNVT